ncbi:hypothetical protein CL617_00820 [archaeon]|nr:hypothetical protein [archaeon]|tara:strand:- start:96 stop:290 length:195 start_codon:yes stop_codon:yes gene_type:complete
MKKAELTLQTIAIAILVLLVLVVLIVAFKSQIASLIEGFTDLISTTTDQASKTASTIDANAITK